MKFLVFSWVRLVSCVVGAVILTCLAVFSQPLYYKWFGWGNTFSYNRGEMAVHFVDVGHGDCTILQFPDGKTAIIDGGEPNQWRNLDNYIRTRIKRKYFDYVINTHPHADHVGGLLELMNRYKFGKFINYRNFSENMVISGAGYRVSLHSILQNPAVSEDVDEDQGANEISPIITVEYGDAVFVMTGDAGFSTELEFYQNTPSAREIFGGRVVGKTWTGAAWVGDGANVKDNRTVYLQIGHHGSQHSTATAFLEFIRPDYAIIPMSATNTYGHPHKTVTDKLDYIGAKTWRTSDDGNIVAVYRAGGSDATYYFGFDNPANFTPLWVLIILLFIVLCWVDYHYILWQKKF